MSDRNPRDRKPPFRRPGGKPFDKGRPAGDPAAGRRPAWRDRDSGADDGPVILYGWHTVTLALQNPARHIRKLLLTENAARRLAEDNIKAPIAPEVVRPSQIDQLLGPDAVHQGLLAEADPLSSPDIETLAAEGMILVLDQITDPHNVGAIMRSAAAFAVKAIVTTNRHSPEATGVLAKSASGALELVPLVLVQNLARALTALNDRGFLTVGLDSEGAEDLGKVELREQFLCPAAGLRAGESGQPSHHPQVLLTGLQFVDRCVLAGEADPAPHFTALANDVEARHARLARIRGQER